MQIVTKTLKGFTLLAKVRKGFALLSKALPKNKQVRTLCADRNQNFERVRTFGDGSQKVSHFCADRNQKVERVHTFGKGSQRGRTFGECLAKNCKGFAFLEICLKGFALLCVFRYGRKGVAVFERERHQAKTTKIGRPFLSHSAFIGLS